MTNLKSIAERTRKVTVTVDGDEVNLTIRPNRFTAARVAQEFEETQSATSAEAVRDFCNFFAELVVHWDVTWDTDSDMVPLQSEVLQDHVPFNFLQAIVVEIGKQQQIPN